jgi:hypothetical protein
MSARTELRETGQLGDDGVRLLYATVRSVARARNFPPPDGAARWTFDGVAEAAHDFLTGTNADLRLITLATASVTDDAFNRALFVTVLNHMRSVARRTTIGRLIRRLKTVLGENEGFQVRGDRVALSVDGDDAEPWHGRFEDLISAAWSVAEIPLVRWSPSAERSAPVADGPSLLQLSEAVLTGACGSLEWATLAQAISGRLGLGGPPVAVDLAEAESSMRDPLPTPAVDLEIHEAALALLRELTDREQAVLATLGETVTAIADQTGLARSTAAWVKTRVIEILQQRLASEPLGEEIYTTAQTLAQARFHLPKE